MARQWRVLTATAALASCLGAAAAAQEEPVTPATKGDAYAHDGTAKKHGTKACRASQILGRDVENAQGENLGEIEDLVLDESTGSVAYAVLEFGGFLGMGDRLFAIPFAALRPGDDGEFVLDVSKETLKNAPGFEKDRWPDVADRKWGGEIHRYYNQTPYWERDGEVASRAQDRTAAGGTAFGEPIDVSRIQNFEGTVVAVERTGDATSPIELTLKVGDRNLSVHLAPDAYLQDKSMQLAENDKIRVKGVVLEKMGKDQVVATEVSKGNQVVPLRRSDGSPAWDRAADSRPAGTPRTNDGGSR